ncbi:putative tubby-like protein [Helianthus annuus]|uniref:Tubby-like protein n=1 Tax=Helianthus annuus TaxID=4232 RepID=A0A9K3J459_HELAN|nr:putative tubby-like protein [Helianthus annuus]
MSRLLIISKHSQAVFSVWNGVLGYFQFVFDKAGESAAGEYTVAKVENMEQTVFTLKSLHRHMQVLHDEDLKLIAVLSKEKLMLHSRWSVSCLSGESKADLKIVCSVCKHRIIQSRVNLNATLEKEIETRIRAAAFKVTGSWEHKRCIIYEEDPIEIIAKVMTPLPLENDKFMVEVRAGVDCAFVVSLIAILIAMKTKSSGKKKGAGLEAGKVALQFVCGVAFGVGQFLLGELSWYLLQTFAG